MRHITKLILVLVAIFALFAFSMSVNAEADAASVAVYVRDGGAGDGSSPTSPVGSLEDAYAALMSLTDIEKNAETAGAIVVCGRLTVTHQFNYNGDIRHAGKVYITSSYAGVDYRKNEDARLVITAPSSDSLTPSGEHRFQLGGPTAMNDLVIDRGEAGAVSLTIYATTELYMSETVEVVNTNWEGTYTEPVRGLTEEEIAGIKLSAHRGYQPMGPENSVLAFEAAGKLGFDYIETDVEKTVDGVLICLHDHTLDRTTNGTGDARYMTYEEILTYKIDTAAYGYDINSADPSKLYVPTFREYLEICKEYGCIPFIEIKDSREDTIHAIIDMALEYFDPEDIVMSCGSLNALKVSYEYNSDIFHHLIWGDQSDEGYANSIATLAEMKNSNGEVYAGIAFNIKGLLNGDNYARAKYWLSRARALGLQTCLRAADDMDEVRKMFELGIDYYPTNTTTRETLEVLKNGKDGGYAFTSASGGKLFIRGGTRYGVTEEEVNITLLGGLYDFVAPSNAEAETTGAYNVTVGGNAFVSRLVAGETAKAAIGEREISCITIKDSATVRDLYVAGDYSSVKLTKIDILGGTVETVYESRGKGGTAQDVELMLAAASLMPATVNVADKNVIKGTKTLIVLDGSEVQRASAWDKVVYPEETTKAPETTGAPETTAPVTAPEPDVTEPKVLPPDCTEPSNNNGVRIAVGIVIFCAVFALGVGCGILFAKRKMK